MRPSSWSTPWRTCGSASAQLLLEAGALRGRDLGGALRLEVEAHQDHGGTGHHEVAVPDLGADRERPAPEVADPRVHGVRLEAVPDRLAVVDIGPGDHVLAPLLAARVQVHQVLDPGL